MPLIVLTADRPPELREVGAGQTIDQLKLYGDFAKWFFDVGTHAATPERLRWIRALACRAVWTALGDRPGVVHLNVALREPLVLDEPLPAEEPGGGGRPDGRPWLLRAAAAGRPGRGGRYAAPPPARRRAPRRRRRTAATSAPRRARATAPQRVRRGGRLPAARRPAVARASGEAAIAHYDALLRDQAFAAAHAPDLVIRIGDLPTSKPLRGWLAALDAPQIVLDPEGAWQDPAAVVAESLAVRAGRPPWPPRSRSSGRRSGLARALARRRRRRRRARSRTSWATSLSEPAVAAALADLPRRGDRVHRVVDARARRRDLLAGPRRVRRACSPTAARTGSTARSPPPSAPRRPARGPVVLHIGDVALAHDLGALLCAHAARAVADHRARRQRRRRDLRLPTGGHPGRRLRGARGHARPASTSPGSRHCSACATARRPRSTTCAPRWTRRSTGRPPRSCTCAPTARPTSRCTAPCGTRWPRSAVARLTARRPATRAGSRPSRSRAEAVAVTARTRHVVDVVAGPTVHEAAAVVHADLVVAAPAGDDVAPVAAVDEVVAVAARMRSTCDAGWPLGLKSPHSTSSPPRPEIRFEPCPPSSSSLRDPPSSRGRGVCGLSMTRFSMCGQFWCDAHPGHSPWWPSAPASAATITASSMGTRTAHYAARPCPPT